MSGKQKKQQQHKQPIGNTTNKGFGKNRDTRRMIAEDTLRLLEHDEETIEAKKGTVLHENIDHIPASPKHELVVEVWRTTTTLQGCADMHKKYGSSFAALNFASAKNPGGGFLRGSNAQEESLCKSSGLYHCLKGNKMYASNRKDNRNCLYHHMAIYSPKVPIIKNDQGETCERHCASFITCPAINATSMKHVGQVLYLEELVKRVDMVLRTAVFHKETVLVLGAFGCGVFGNDVRVIAKTFETLLSKKYKGYFKHIVFAVISEEDATAFDKLATR